MNIDFRQRIDRMIWDRLSWSMLFVFSQLGSIRIEQNKFA